MAGPQANIRNFIAPLAGPGRSAPSLLEDLILFDPARRLQPGYHLLEDGSRAFSRAQHIGELLPEGSCVHDYCLKKRQSVLPAIDEQPSPYTVWTAAAICQKCRIHLHLTVDYRVAWQDEPCPTHEHPLHHFVRSTWRQDQAYRELQKDGGNESEEIHVYECSWKRCSAIATVHMKPPVIPDDAIHLLTNKDLLAKRTNAAFELKQGHTEGMKRPTALDVLADLRTYLKNAWLKSGMTEIACDNKRFVVRFGPDGAACSNVLDLLRFELKPGVAWIVPQPIPNSTLPLQDEHNIFLDNVEAELDVLIANRPEEERLAAVDTTKLAPAFTELSRVLSCQNYDRITASRTAKGFLLQRPRAFTVLGIPEDASDALVIWAYQRQVMAEEDVPKQTAKLMTALEDIQQQRQSEQLSEQVQLERSIGRYGEQTIADAYRELGLPPDDSITDDTIIGNFESRLVDAPMQEDQMRQCLAAIGQYRKSRRLEDFARRAVSTYEDALNFLDANPSMDDEYLGSLYSAKLVDNPSSQDMAQKAIQLIADHRNSEALKSFITAGFQGDVNQNEMDVPEAYQLLGIQDRTIPDDVIWMTYELTKGDGSVNQSKLEQAIKIIAEDRDSGLLRSNLGITASQQTDQQAAMLLTEPVGLNNIGNTCYLNSLLQSLFTLTTVRKIVLDFQNYQQDLDDLQDKRVGQRLVTEREVRSAQDFVAQLAGLFQQMIASPKHAIQPTQELARLTLETEKIKQERRRRSTIQAQRRATLGMIDNRPIIGPLPPPSVNGDANQALQSPEAMDGDASEKQPYDVNGNGDTDPQGQTRQELLDSDNASDQTLISQGGSKSGSTTSEELKQPEKDVQMNMIDEPLSTVEHMSLDSGMDVETVAAASTTTTRPHEPAMSRTVSPDPPIQDEEGTTTNQALYKPPEGPPPSGQMTFNPPPGPPPIPPRPTPTYTLEFWAKQQDVTEVLPHAINQLSCAIRPTGKDKRNEQLDEIHDTFYGEEQRHRLDTNTTIEDPIQFSYQILPIHNEPKNLYGAMDNYYDPENRAASEVYLAINKLPPILCCGLGRVVYKMEKNAKEATPYKINHHVEIPNIMFMDRYMDAPNESMLVERRKQTWQYKKELKLLKTRMAQLEPKDKPTVDEALDAALATIRHLAEVETTEKLDGLTLENQTVDTLSRLLQAVKQERFDLTGRIAVLEQHIKDSFTDAAFRKQEYKLHAIFFHRGSDRAGHYWIYIYDHVNEIWRKYNDDKVTHVNNLKEIFGDPYSDNSNPNSGYNPATPYFLIYVRSDQISTNDNQEGAVETVCRNPIIPPSEPAAAAQAQVKDGDTNIDDEGMELRPLGSNTPPKNYEIHSSHHEFADQPSQMTSMPPDAPRLQGQEPPTQDANSNYANIGSIMDRGRPPPNPRGHQKDDSWEADQIQQAINLSLQQEGQQEQGQWHDPGNTTHHPSVW